MSPTGFTENVYLQALAHLLTIDALILDSFVVHAQSNYMRCDPNISACASIDVKKCFAEQALAPLFGST